MIYISKLRVFVLSALVASVGLAVAGCGSAATTAPAASTVAPTTATSTTDLTPTQVSEAPISGSSGGSSVDIQVTNFTVSQNLEVRGQFNATNNGKTTVQELTPIRIVVKRPDGEVALDASTQGGVMDMKAMAGLPLGMTRPYGFSASPGKISAQVAEGDEVTGMLTVRIDGHEQEISMPITRVTTIRIP